LTALIDGRSTATLIGAVEDIPFAVAFTRHHTWTAALTALINGRSTATLIGAVEDIPFAVAFTRHHTWTTALTALINGRSTATFPRTVEDISFAVAFTRHHTWTTALTALINGRSTGTFPGTVENIAHTIAPFRRYSWTIAHPTIIHHATAGPAAPIHGTRIRGTIWNALKDTHAPITQVAGGTISTGSPAPIIPTDFVTTIRNTGVQRIARSKTIIKSIGQSIIKPILIHQTLGPVLQGIGPADRLVRIGCILIGNTITVGINHISQVHAQRQFDHQLDINNIYTSITIHVSKRQGQGLGGHGKQGNNKDAQRENTSTHEGLLFFHFIWM